MATSVSTLIQRTRFFLRDQPAEDVLTASVSSSGTTLTVGDGTLYADNWLVELDSEILFVNGNGTGTNVTVRRGQRGTTATTHASGATVLLRPTFSSEEILAALNAIKDECYPKIYKPVNAEYTGLTAGTYEFEVPDMPGITGLPIPYLSRLQIKETGGTEFFEVRGWRIKRGATPFIQFGFDPSTGTLRVEGYGPFPELTLSGSLDDLWPLNAVGLLPLGAASYLLAARESDRATGRGMQDDVGEWSKLQGIGVAMSASERLYARFQRQLFNAAMPPLPPHVVPVF